MNPRHLCSFLALCLAATAFADSPQYPAKRPARSSPAAAEGLLLKEIADHLSSSHATVQTHIGRIYKKLHVHSRSEAVACLHGKFA